MRVACLLAAICTAAPSANALAQQGAADAGSQSLRLYMACVGASCDEEFLRTELTIVEHVRDRQNADVQLLITGQATATGGQELTFSFFGQGRFTGRDHVLTETFLVAASDDEVRRGIQRIVELGLVPYLLETPAADRLRLMVEPAATEAAAAAASAVDPWNRWSVRLNVSGSMSGEESTQSSFVTTDVNANRTTDETKVNLNLRFNYRESRFELPDGRRFLAPSKERGVDWQYVKSLDEHWSAGMRADWTSSTFSNQDWSSFAGPAIEWNLFPYMESTRRLLTLNYSVGARAWDYERETIFGKLEEVRAVQKLDTTLALRQRWGTVGANLEVASFVPDVDKRHASLFGAVSLNVVKGLSVSVNASADSIRDQITLPREQATSEEVLVNVRQLATTHRYTVFLGVSYTFGSIFSPIVNPRFGGGQ